MSMLGKLVDILQTDLLQPRSGAEAPARNPGLDQVVRVCGDSLAAAKNMEATLTPALDYAIRYFDTQVRAIPGAFGLSISRHPDEPFLARHFPAREDVTAALGRSVEVKEALPALAPEREGHVYAVLGMRIKPGAAEGGHPLFADHTLRCLAMNEADSRAGLRQAALSRLLHAFKDHTDKLRKAGKLLRVEWTLGKEAPPQGVAAGSFIHAEEELTPDNLVKGLVSWLKSPSEFLRIDTTDALGGEGGPVLPVMHSADTRKWLVCQVKFSATEGMEALKRETRVHRYMLI
ncbi:MAG: hypothetical protein EG825_12140 [Rhodocyclaceae bacterium]|nr:hypothetical protein [Rhodocyclaceae bacterium]